MDIGAKRCDCATNENAYVWQGKNWWQIFLIFCQKQCNVASWRFLCNLGIYFETLATFLGYFIQFDNIFKKIQGHSSSFLSNFFVAVSIVAWFFWKPAWLIIGNLFMITTTLDWSIGCQLYWILNDKKRHLHTG